MAQFPLLMNGAEVCTLEDLKRNFDPNALIEYRKRFAAWLKGWDYDEEAVEVKSLDPELTDEQWLDEICKILDCVDVWSEMRQSFGEKKKKEEVQEVIKEIKQSESPEVQEKLLSETRIEISSEKHKLPKGEKYSFFATSSAFIVKSDNKCFLSNDGKEYRDISSAFSMCEWMTCVNNYFIKYEKSNIKFSTDGLNWNIVKIEEIFKQPYKKNFCLYDILYVNGKYTAIWRNENTDWYRFSVSNSLNEDWEEIGSVESYAPIEKISYYSGIYFAQSANETFYTEDFKKWSKIWDNYCGLASSLQKRLPSGVELKKIDEHYYSLFIKESNSLIVSLFGREISLVWNGNDIFMKNSDNSSKINLATISFPIHSLFYTNGILWISGPKGELASGKIIFMGEDVQQMQEETKEKKKIEPKRKKVITPTPENIRVIINNKKSPFCDSVTDKFVCEKGVIVNTKSDQLYFSSDGEHFTPIVPNSKSYHYYKNFSYLNGYLVFQDSDLVYFSQDGHEWDSFDFEDILPAGSKDYDSPNYKVLPSIENIVYNNNRKSFTIFYSFNRDVGVGNDITKIYCMSTASKLDGSWTDWGEINSFPFLEPGKFYWTQGKYFTSVSWGQEKYGYNAKYDNGVYFSEDGLKWTQAEESDKNWLDGLEVEDSNIWMHIDYCNCKDGQMRYFLEEAKIIPWGEIYFSHGDDTIKAWKEDFEKQPVSEECDFAIKTVACFNDKLLIFGENNEFAIGEIRVKG